MRSVLLVILALVVVVAGFTVVIALHRPPMRLMPPPAVFLDRRVAPALEAVIEQRIPLFYATNREARGTREDREYARVAGEPLHAGQLTIRIGDDATPLDRIVEWSTGTSDEPRPYLHLDAVD